MRTLPGMRRPTSFATALLGGAVIAAALSGCSGASGSPPPAPSASASATDAPSGVAADLIGTSWTVQEVHGDRGAGGSLRFGDRSVTLVTTTGTSTFAWAAQGAEVLITRSTLSMDGGGPATWLTGTVRVSRDTRGWTLADETGAATARLVPAASSSPQPSPSDTAAPLAVATPGPGATATPASALAGRWHLAGHPTTAITFDDGRWRAAASCETGASGGSGAYRVLADGRLLITRTASLMFGCPIGQDDDRVRAPAIAGIDRAGSFRVEGTTLTLFDRSGAVIGSLVR